MNQHQSRFAVFDIDGTIFRSGFAREIVYELIASNKAPASMSQAFAQHERDWKTRQSVNAFSEYEEAMAVAFDAAITSLKCTDFDSAATAVFDRVSDHVYAYTRDLVQRLRQEGYTLIAISGSHEELVRPFAEKYGFDIWVGQHCERGKDGYFTGKILKTHDGKDTQLQKIAAEHGLTFAESIAVGDSGGDIGMLSLVDHPIAFNPERRLFDKAKQEGWHVVVERKNMVYTLEPHGQSFILA
jgi:HAD superfamily hydrolase (TIGR01490 family)